MASSLRTPAVVTALNLNGLGVARALGRRGVPVYGIHSGPDGPELCSRYVREVWRNEPGQDVAELLIQMAPRFGDIRPVVIPITDDSVESVARSLDRLTPHYAVPMGDPATVLRLLSKEGIDAAARRQGMPVPATRVCSTLAELESALAVLRPPFIIKPQEKSEAYARSGARKAFRLDTREEVVATWRTFCDHEPRVVVQEFIGGTDADVWFCLVAIGKDGALLGSFVGHKLRQWPPHCGGTASCEPGESPELVDLTTRFFREEGLRGVGSMEFKRDPRDGRHYVIEPTVCRTDWQSAIADNNGVPIPYLIWCAETGAPIPPIRRTWLRWRWVHLNSERRAADYYRRRGELGRLAWLWSIRPPVRPAYWAIDDPRPGLAIAGETIRRAFRKVGRLFGGTPGPDPSRNAAK